MQSDQILVLVLTLGCFRYIVAHATVANLKRREYVDPTTFRGGELNEPCRMNNDCGTFGYFCAPNKTCQCADLYLSNYRRNVCLGGVDQRCQYDEHCIDGAYCMNQSSCQCKEHQPYPSVDGLQCTSATSTRLSPTLIISISLFILCT